MEANKELTKEFILDKNRKHILTITDRDNILTSMEEYANQWKVKYDGLVAELEDLKRGYTFSQKELLNCSKDYATLQQQHQQLKDQTQRLTYALGSILEIRIAVSDGEIEPFAAFTKIAYTANSTLSEYNQAKGV